MKLSVSFRQDLGHGDGGTNLGVAATAKAQDHNGEISQNFWTSATSSYSENEHLRVLCSITSWLK